VARNRWRVVIVAAAVLLCSMSTGCGGDDSGGDAQRNSDGFCTSMEFVRDNWGVSPEQEAELGGYDARIEQLQAALRDGGTASPETSEAFDRLAFLIGPEPTRPRSDADLDELGVVTAEGTRITSEACGFDPLF
jgi:hypothetical protein